MSDSTDSTVLFWFWIVMSSSYFVGASLLFTSGQHNHRVLNWGLAVACIELGVLTSVNAYIRSPGVTFVPISELMYYQRYIWMTLLITLIVSTQELVGVWGWIRGWLRIKR